MMKSCSLTLFLMLTFLNASRSEEPPIAGRPLNFSGAKGSFKISTRATPVASQAEDPILFTLRIIGTGNLTEFPRPQLDQIDAWRRLFHITNGAERHLPTEKAREFDYILRPRSAAVRQIPPLPFVYWRPDIIPPEKGYQTTYAPAIPLKITPRHQVPESTRIDLSTVRIVPPSVKIFPQSSELLQGRTPEQAPPWWAFALILFLPPLATVGIQFAFRRSQPVAAPRARRRQSKAAERALLASQSLPKLAAAFQPVRAGEIVSDYLRDLRAHFTHLPSEPTPKEVSDYLRSRGAFQETIEVTAAFFERCAWDRFAPEHAAHDGWQQQTVEIIRMLEDEPCLHSPS
jgi:hypothetical protein